MNVGLVIYGSLYAPSGGYRYDRELVRRLESRGATVSLFRQPWRTYPLRLMGSLDRAFRSRIERARLDVLLEDELNHPSLLAMPSASNIPPRVSIVHHLRTSEQHSPAAKALYRKVERRYLDSVDAFICNSDTTASVVRETSARPRPLVVAKPGGREIEVPTSAAEVLAKAEEQPLRILFVGQLTRRKGLHILLDAVSTLQVGEWRLEVVGDAEAEPRYARRCKARARSLRGAVRFHGHLDGAALDAAYRKAHVLCVPSQYEGYGIVYQEALQYGVPAIATEGGAAREIVEDGRTGYIVAVESRQAVSSALARFADRERLASMSVRALEQARTFPSWRENMDRAVDFVEDIVSRHQGGRSIC